VLGTITRRLADAAINLTTVYLATDTRLVLGCEDIAAADKIYDPPGC